MSDFTHLPIPEGYRLVRRGYPRTGETLVYGGGLQKASFNYKYDTHNIVEKIPSEEKPMMEIPKGWKFVANRPPLEGEWFIDSNNKSLTKATHTWTCLCPAVVEPIIPYGWEFVDYRSPIKDEWYIFGKDVVVQATSLTEKYKGSHYRIVRKKETQVKPNLESYSYTPKVDPITPRDIYGSYLEEIPAVLGEKWEIVDFRPVTCCDYYIGNNFFFYEVSDYEPSYADRDIAKPRFIVKKLREITDTERLEYLMDLNSYTWAKDRKGIDKKIRENEKKGN